jgi:hypothetical protein
MRSRILHVFLLGLVFCGATTSARAWLRTPSELQPAGAASGATTRLATPRPPAVVRLDDATAAESGSLVSAAGREQVGFARVVMPLRTAGALLARLTWSDVGGERRVAAIAITSPGAAALRVALRVGAVPRGTRVRFANATGAASEVDAADIEAAIGRNLYYDDDTPAAHLYWSPLVEGETLVLEVEIPRAAAPADLRLAVPMLSHLVNSPARAFAPCGAGQCDGDLGPTDGAAARIVFTDQGATFACSGMLVADRDSATVIPYFLTARHCVASQSVASSVQPFWPAGAATCTLPAATLEAGAQGAVFLHADGDSDLTLLRLQRTPPAGATYAGWVVGGGAANVAADALVKVVASGDASAPHAQLGECSAGGRASVRFESAYNAGLYQWLGGTPQDAREAREVQANGSP